MRMHESRKFLQDIALRHPIVVALNGVPPMDLHEVLAEMHSLVGSQQPPLDEEAVPVKLLASRRERWRHFNHDSCLRMRDAQAAGRMPTTRPCCDRILRSEEHTSELQSHSFI